MKFFLVLFIFSFFTIAEDFKALYEKLATEYQDQTKDKTNPYARLLTASKIEALKETAGVQFKVPETISVEQTLKKLLSARSRNYQVAALGYIYTHRKYSPLILEALSELDWTLIALECPDSEVYERASENLKNGKFKLSSEHLKHLSTLAVNVEYTNRVLPILTSPYNNENERGYYRFFEIAKKVLSQPTTAKNKTLQARFSAHLAVFLREHYQILSSHFDTLYGLADYHTQLHILSYLFNEKIEVTTKIIDTLVAYYQHDPKRSGLQHTLLKIAFHHKNKDISEYLLDSLEKNNIVLREEFYALAYLSKNFSDPLVPKFAFEKLIHSEAIHLIPETEVPNLSNLVQNSKAAPTQHLANYFIQHLKGKFSDWASEALLQIVASNKNISIENSVFKILVANWTTKALKENNFVEIRKIAQILELEAAKNLPATTEIIDSHLKAVLAHKNAEVVKESSRLVPFASLDVVISAFVSPTPQMAIAATDRLKKGALNNSTLETILYCYIDNRNPLQVRELLIHQVKNNQDLRSIHKLIEIFMASSQGEKDYIKALELLDFLDKDFNQIDFTLFSEALLSPHKDTFQKSHTLMTKWANQGNASAKKILLSATKDLLNTTLSDEQKAILLKTLLPFASETNGELFMLALKEGNTEIQTIAISGLAEVKQPSQKTKSIAAIIAAAPRNLPRLKRLISALNKKENIALLTDAGIDKILFENSIHNTDQTEEAFEILLELQILDKVSKTKQEFLAINLLLSNNLALKAKAYASLNRYWIQTEEAFEYLLSQLFKITPDDQLDSDYARVMNIIDAKVNNNLIQKHLMEKAIKLRTLLHPAHLKLFDQHIQILKAKLDLNAKDSENILRLLKMYFSSDEKLSDEAYKKLLAIDDFSHLEASSELDHEIAKLSENLPPRNGLLAYRLKDYIHKYNFNEAYTDNLLSKLNDPDFYFEALGRLINTPYVNEAQKDYIANKIFDLVLIKSTNTDPGLKLRALFFIYDLQPTKNLSAKLDEYLKSNEGSKFRGLFVKENCVVRFLKSFRS